MYFKTDICHLSDVFQKFSKFTYETYNLDPRHSHTLPTFAIKQMINTKQKLGMGNNFTMNDLSEELNKPVINKFKRKKVIVNHIDEIHSCDLVDMVKYSRVNRGYKYIYTNIDIFSKYAWPFPLKTKTIKEIKSCFQKIFKEWKPAYIWSDQESAFFSKEMLYFLIQ